MGQLQSFLGLTLRTKMMKQLGKCQIGRTAAELSNYCGKTGLLILIIILSWQIKKDDHAAESITGYSALMGSKIIGIVVRLEILLACIDGLRKPGLVELNRALAIYSSSARFGLLSGMNFKISSFDLIPHVRNSLQFKVILRSNLSFRARTRVWKSNGPS